MQRIVNPGNLATGRQSAWRTDIYIYNIYVYSEELIVLPHEVLDLI